MAGPADVAASRYLYDLTDQAFAMETASFRIGATYAELPSRFRRTATNSFQIGLGRGITATLHALREARETVLRRSSGRDLVVVKAGIVDEELSSLGLNLRARSRSGGRRVLKDAFDQGHTAGLGFSYTPAVTQTADAEGGAVGPVSHWHTSTKRHVPCLRLSSAPTRPL